MRPDTGWHKLGSGDYVRFFPHKQRRRREIMRVFRDPDNYDQWYVYEVMSNLYIMSTDTLREGKEQAVRWVETERGFALEEFR